MSEQVSKGKCPNCGARMGFLDAIFYRTNDPFKCSSCGVVIVQKERSEIQKSGDKKLSVLFVIFMVLFSLFAPYTLYLPFFVFLVICAFLYNRYYLQIVLVEE